MNCLTQISFGKEPVMLDSMLDLGWARSILTLLEVSLEKLMSEMVTGLNE